MRRFGYSLVVVVLALAVAAPAFSVFPTGPVAPDETSVYVGITPCAVFDTRTGIGTFTGPLDGGTTLTAQVTGTIPPAQGGAASLGDCDAPPANAEITGVLINLVAVTPNVGGNLRVSASGVSAVGGVVNFQALTTNLNNANAVVTNVTIGGGDVGLIDVFVNAGTTPDAVHARGIILGYFVRATDVFESFDRTIVVGGSGTPTENGTALRTAVIDANSQTPTATDPWLIKLEPGTFDLGTTTTGLTLPGHVHLQGSGQAATTITGNCTARTIHTTTPLGGGGVTHITDLTITNTSTGSTADGIDNASGTAVLEVTGSTVTTAGGTGITNAHLTGAGLEVTDSTVTGGSGITNLGTATVRDSHIESTGPDTAGIFNTSSGGLVVTGSTVTGIHGGFVNHGTATVRDSHIETIGTSTFADGISSSGVLEVTGSTVTTAGDDGIANSGTVTVRDSHVESTGTGTDADGIYNAPKSAVLEVTGSTVATAGDDGIENHGRLTVSNSHIESARTGLSLNADGIHNASSTAVLEVTGSTVTATGDDGIENSGTVTVSHVTLDAPDAYQAKIGTTNTCVATSTLNPTVTFSATGCP